MAQQQQQATGLQVLTTTQGKRIIVGPQAQEIIRRDAVQQGVSFLEELRDVWQELENAETRPPRDMLRRMHQRINSLHGLLSTVETFTPGDAYWEGGNQQFGPIS